jgi:rod shape-determining protein MreD
MKVTILIIFLTIIINFILQSTILPYISILGVVPNTTLVIVVIISLLRGKYYGSFTGLIMGLLQDIIFSPVIGVNGFIYFFIGYFVGLGENRLSKDSVLIPILITIVSTLFYNFAYYVFMFFLSREILFLPLVKNIVPIEVLYNSLVSIGIYKIFSKILIVPSIRFGRR